MRIASSFLRGPWRQRPPRFDFYTPLPYIGEQFITGDHAVLVVHMDDNPIWVPNDDPKRAITSLGDILNNPKHGFQVSLSPYVMVSIHGQAGQEPGLPPRTIEPRDVRFFNNRIRGQCNIFTLGVISWSSYMGSLRMSPKPVRLSA